MKNVYRINALPAKGIERKRAHINGLGFRDGYCLCGLSGCAAGAEQG
jgi:hypothetical protein